MFNHEKTTPIYFMKKETLSPLKKFSRSKITPQFHPKKKYKSQ